MSGVMFSIPAGPPKRGQNLRVFLLRQKSEYSTINVGEAVHRVLRAPGGSCTERDSAALP